MIVDGCDGVGVSEVSQCLAGIDANIAAEYGLFAITAMNHLLLPSPQEAV